MPAPVRTEGLTERLGDVLISCSGSNPGAVLAGNFTVALPVVVTNRIGSTNLTTDAVIAADLGGGFVPLPTTNQINGNTIVFNGISVTVPPSGSFFLRISNIRVAAAQLGPVQSGINAQLLFSGSALPLDQVTVTVAFGRPSLFTTVYNRGSIPCVGSPIPDTIDLPNLFAAGTFFVSNRVTEGFATAFTPRAGADTNGVRFLLRFSGFPAGTRIFVPDYIAGSSAAQQTAAGDLGVPQSGGAWATGSNTLLLGRVTGADSSGAGGTVALPTGVGTIAFAGASEIALTTGNGVAVFEVLDSNASIVESAQVPVFIGVPAGTAATVAQERLSYGPISTVAGASSTAPVLRFLDIPPADDCTLVGDCAAGYFPKLHVEGGPIRFTAIQGGAAFEPWGWIGVGNDGGGVMPWTVTVQYTDGNGWLNLPFNSGVNNSSIHVTANPRGLAAGTYRADVVIDGGPRAGSARVPVTLTVSPAPTAPSTGSGSGGGATLPIIPVPPAGVTISKIVNAATFKPTPLVAGSLGTIMGANLAGKAVTVTLDGVAADVLYGSATQINFVVPKSLRGKNSATMTVKVDDSSATPQTVILAGSWPAIFARGVLNQDNSVNGQDTAAAAGSVLQIYGTGIAEGATVSVEIGDRRDLVPMYAGAAPDVPGVQQINVALPDGVAGAVPVKACVVQAPQPVCSPAYTVVVR